jgi:hypothetical protein
MQADKNVIILKESDKAQLLSPKEGASVHQLHGDSSDFESDQHESYIEKLRIEVKEKEVKITEREQQLLSGVHTQHLKQQVMQSTLKQGFIKRLSLMKAVSPQPQEFPKETQACSERSNFMRSDPNFSTKLNKVVPL